MTFYFDLFYYPQPAETTVSVLFGVYVSFHIQLCDQIFSLLLCHWVKISFSHQFTYNWVLNIAETINFQRFS